MKKSVALLLLTLLLFAGAFAGCGSGDLWFIGTITERSDDSVSVSVPEEYRNLFGDNLILNTGNAEIGEQVEKIINNCSAGDRLQVSFKVGRFGGGIFSKKTAHLYAVDIPEDES